MERTRGRHWYMLSITFRGRKNDGISGNVDMKGVMMVTL